MCFITPLVGSVDSSRVLVACSFASVGFFGNNESSTQTHGSLSIKQPYHSKIVTHDDPAPSNTNAPRTLDGVYLRYNDNEQGGHNILHLQTGCKITRRRVTPLPITPAVIKQVHRLAEMDGMSKGLKITNHTGQVIYDSTWIAGVDYDEDQFNDEDYNPESDNGDDSDDDDSNNNMDKMDPNKIAALAEPLELQQDDEGNEESKEEEVLDKQEPEEEEQDSQEDEDDEDPNPTTAKEQPPQVTTRSGRISKPREVLTLHQCHLQAQAHQQEEYSIETARVVAMTMCHLNVKMGSLSGKEKISHA